MSNPLLQNGPIVAQSAAAAFRFRRGLRSDLRRCAELLPSGFRASDCIKEQLVTLWERLLMAEGQTFSIIEDMERPHPANIEGFGLSVFVTDRFFNEFCAAPRPYLAACFYERMLAGEPVVMSAEQIRRANSTTGLNIVVLHFGLGNEDLSHPRTAQLLLVGSASFYFFHSGYRINALANEIYGEQQTQYMERGGFRRVRDFQRESPADFEGMPPQQYPHLVLLRKEWVQPAVIDPMSQLFLHRPQRIRFSTSERRVLEGALLNESDAQLANRLGVSIDSIKKSWRNIYARASRQVPSLVPAADPESSGSRGQEKRRHLLDYLRTHLEELRPGPGSARKS